MKLSKPLLSAMAFLLGIVFGFAASFAVREGSERSMAVASIFAAGEALRSNNLVTAMIHAQSIVHYAPETYDGYQIVGDVYARQGYKLGADEMYKLSLDRLLSGHEKAMLVEAGVTSVETAQALLRRKISSLE